ncbi:MAG: type III-B CRISPR module RAMP protein Cmr4, partial [Anaerolineae bacterium]|nr:type III-B CRISPR module RAMP protein Cmr4 [Anaerolineae bacterium]
MYTQWRFILMTLDPVHIGTGGYRLGRVDLSIAREPGTNLPKIPGTSLSGAVRTYAAYRYGRPQCAGQGQGDEARGKRPHCRERDCPVCYTFGYIRGPEGGHAGTVSIADAQLLLFPVHSMAGPVWVSTAQRLAEAGLRVQGPPLARGEFATTLTESRKPLNVGWLLLTRKDGQVEVEAPPGEVNTAAWQAVAQRLVLVEEGLFSQVVNSNLEVRTSVSIDPTTGAASEGALFTYEALPRATWLWGDVVEDCYRSDEFPRQNDKAAELRHTRPWDVVREGLRLAEYLGIGGMGTRGFGRVRLTHEWEVPHG